MFAEYTINDAKEYLKSLQGKKTAIDKAIAEKDWMKLVSEGVAEMREGDWGMQFRLDKNAYAFMFDDLNKTPEEIYEAVSRIGDV